LAVLFTPSATPALLPAAMLPDAADLSKTLYRRTPMRRIVSLAAAALLGAAFLVAGCHSQNDQSTTASPGPAEPAVSSAVAKVKPSGISATQPSFGQVTGTVIFMQHDNDTLLVTVNLTGFPPNSEHGFHVHDKGDLSAADLSSAGGHFNPTHEHHGGPFTPHHHAGDLGNLHADDQGNVKIQFTVSGLHLTGPTGILGHSVIIHAKADDLASDPAGNSGPRVAGGVIVAQ